jgi:hypothetical protein
LQTKPAAGHILYQNNRLAAPPGANPGFAHPNPLAFSSCHQNPHPPQRPKNQRARNRHGFRCQPG